jgi:hypothetical protein
MPRSEEIAHYSDLVASLIVSTARARRREDLVELRSELAEAFSDIWTLLSHDAFEQRPAGLEAVLLRLVSRDERLEELAQ